MIGLGGNTEGTLSAFSAARSWLSALLRAPVFSSLYGSTPMFDLDQAPFWNAVVAGQWSGTAEGLLERLLMFESSLGRTRDSFRPKGPRVIDLDLLVAGTRVVDSPRLTLPHPGLAGRRFALEPLLEVLPQLRHPLSGLSWSELLPALLAQAVDRSDRTW